ncbi:HNH endonuclease [Escherichia coli]|uniref:HNH endonuclease n=2 Tax=Escherichia TaxID=561 RepID=UPI001BFED834|nr:HNH endonuclease [Escherichia coli]
MAYSKHGMTHTKLYKVFIGMKTRCKKSNNNPRNKHYREKGITICDEWLNDSSKFIEWALNNGYQEGLEIDRIDNDKGYSPDNCRWVTHAENMRNTCKTRMLTVNGETNTIHYFSEKYGIGEHTIHIRLRLGWSHEAAVLLPLRKEKIREKRSIQQIADYSANAERAERSIQ